MTTTEQTLQDNIFRPADHLLGILQSKIAANENVRIALPGKGEVSIHPARGEYYASVPDMAEFCLAPATAFQVSPLGAAAPAQSAAQARPLKELLWQAGFHASQGRLPDGCNKFDVVEFRQWPNLAKLPMTPNTMRICALLTRHPTTVTLIHRKLGAEASEVYQILSAASSAGLTHKISRSVGAVAEQAEAESVAAEPVEERGLFRSLFAKIAGL